MIKSKTFKTGDLMGNESKYEEGEFKEPYFFVSSWIFYVQFLHRVLKFVEISKPIDLNTLCESISRSLF